MGGCFGSRHRTDRLTGTHFLDIVLFPNQPLNVSMTRVTGHENELIRELFVHYYQPTPSHCIALPKIPGRKHCETMKNLSHCVSGFIHKKIKIKAEQVLRIQCECVFGMNVLSTEL